MRIDHPSRDPEYRRAVAVGAQKAKTMTFESEGHRRDYERNIRSNPNNVYGLPEFFPPEIIRSRNFNPVTEADREEIVLLEKKRQYVMLYCDSVICKKETLHRISDEQGLCEECKTFKPYRTVHYTPTR